MDKIQQIIKHLEYATENGISPENMKLIMSIISDIESDIIGQKRQFDSALAHERGLTEFWSNRVDQILKQQNDQRNAKVKK